MQNLFKRDFIFALFSSTLTRRRPLQLSVKEYNIHIFQLIDIVAAVWQQRPKTTGNQQPIGVDIVLSEYFGRGHTKKCLTPTPHPPKKKEWNNLPAKKEKWIIKEIKK